MVYQHLSEKTHLAKLSEACQRFSLENFSLVIPTEWYLSLSIKEVEEYLSDDALNAVSEDDVIDATLNWLQSSRASKARKEDYMEILMTCIRLEFCTKSKLEAWSKDPNAMDKFRLRIYDYIHHGVYGGQRPKRSYSGVLIPIVTGTSTSALGAKSATPATGSGPTSILSARTSSTTAAPTSGTTSASASERAAVGLTTSLADQGEETLLILGGYTSNEKQYKDILYLDNEPQGSVITQAPSNLFSVCTAEDSDAFIVSGGNDFSTGTSVPHVRTFNFTTKTWTNLPDMKRSVERHGSTVIDNKLFIICGKCRTKSDTKQRYAAVNSLDLHTLMWSDCPPMHQTVSDPGIASVDRDILVMGGHNGNEWSSEVCKFNTQTGKWSRCQNLPMTGNICRSTVVVQHSVFVLHREVFLQYGVDIDQWHELTKPIKLSYAPAMVLKQGCLVAVGGYEKKWTEPNDFIQSYDLASKKWSIEKKKIPLPLLWHWAVVVKMP